MSPDPKGWSSIRSRNRSFHNANERIGDTRSGPKRQEQANRPRRGHLQEECRAGVVEQVAVVDDEHDLATVGPTTKRRDHRAEDVDRLGVVIGRQGNEVGEDRQRDDARGVGRGDPLDVEPRAAESVHRLPRQLGLADPGGASDHDTSHVTTGERLQGFSELLDPPGQRPVTHRQNVATPARLRCGCPIYPFRHDRRTAPMPTPRVTSSLRRAVSRLRPSVACWRGPHRSGDAARGFPCRGGW